jgi:CelD/BcsL family acetyltransferase involved in cellulose biosynthesis
VIATAQDVARLSLVDALAWGPEAWDQLVRRSPTPSPFMRWAWHQAWLDTAPAEEARSAFVLALSGRDRTPEALIPLRLRQLHFRRARATALVWPTANVGCPDHLDAPARAGAMFDLAIPWLEELSWDLVMLRHVAEDATGVAQLCEAFQRRGYAVRRATADPCPYLDLPADWDAYLASLSSTRRQTIRRKERALGRAHAVSITDYSPDRLDEGWRHLRALHEQRWGHAGAFADEQVERLLRRFTSELAARDELWLTTLDVDGTPVAAWYGFAWNDTVSYYQGGRDPRWEPHSVGAVLMGAMIRRAIERGYRRFDFLRGREAYKLSWTSTERVDHDVIVFRRGLRGTVLRGLDVVGAARASFLASDQKMRVAP